MTAINVMGAKSGAYFMTDAACYDEQNVVTMWKSKCKTFPRLRLGIATSGTRGDGEIMISQLDMMDSYEQAIREMPELVRTAHDLSGYGEFLVFIAGWNEEKRCGEAFKISTMQHLGKPAFRLEPHHIAMSVPPSIQQLVNAGIRTPEGRAAIEDPEEILTRIIKLQRSVKFPMDDPDASPYCIGGVAELTVINASGIHQREVLRWPDRLYEPIDPFASVKAVAPRTSVPAVGLSRRERRAAEAKARKAS